MATTSEELLERLRQRSRETPEERAAHQKTYQTALKPKPSAQDILKKLRARAVAHNEKEKNDELLDYLQKNPSTAPIETPPKIIKDFVLDDQ